MLPAEALGAAWIKPQWQQLVRAAPPSEKDLRSSWLLLRLFVASLRVTSLTSEYTRASFEVLEYVVSRWKPLVGWKTKLLQRQFAWPHGPGPLPLQEIMWVETATAFNAHPSWLHFTISVIFPKNCSQIFIYFVALMKRCDVDFGRTYFRNWYFYLEERE